MPDIVDGATRSRMMAGIRSRDTRPELAVRRYLHANGLRFRVHRRDLPGSPDIVLPRHRAIVSVNGCFWHRHPGCRYAYKPKSNIDFWEAKFAANIARDSAVRDQLEAGGWRVFTVWECQISSSQLQPLVGQILGDIGESHPDQRIVAHATDTDPGRGADRAGNSQSSSRR